MLKKKGFAVLVALMLVTLLLSLQTERKENAVQGLGYPKFLEMAEKGEVRKVIYTNEAFWQVELSDGKVYQVPNPRNEDSKERLLKNGIEVVEKEKINMLPLVFLMFLCFVFFSRQKGGMEAMPSGDAASHIPDKTFQDVIIDKDTLSAMEDLKCYLKNPDIYEEMGARPPRGVLLYGPPGTGKTLLAQALAGEVKKGFFAVSGSDFVQVYVGVGASRIRSLFKKARKEGGGVIFIDEIDALGKKRDNANDEREQTLNALLTEMNGFHGKDGIIVLAATNRPDTLDAALLREGRFDRRIEIGLPDREGRERMLMVHTKNKHLASDVDIKEMAARTALFSGAQLESMVNEAAIRAIREGKKEISMAHLETAFYAQIAGDERKKTGAEKEKKMIAVHEAGHAVLTHALLPEHTLTRVTVLPSSKGAAGYSLSIQPDRLLYTKQELLCHMAVALGGRAAEEMMFGRENVSNGAGSDLEKAEEMAAQMVKWHMAEEKDAQEGKQSLMKKAYEIAKSVLEERRGRVEKMAQALMEKETLNEGEILFFVA